MTLTLSEFTVTLDRATLPSGKVTVVARSDGGEEHEVVLVRAGAVADLPTKADGSVDEDKISDADKAGGIDHINAHETRSATLDLPPGTYVAFCNAVDQRGEGTGSGQGAGGDMMDGGTGGHVHFALGMHQLVTVI